VNALLGTEFSDSHINVCIYLTVICLYIVNSCTIFLSDIVCFVSVGDVMSTIMKRRLRIPLTLVCSFDCWQFQSVCHNELLTYEQHQL